MDVDSAPAAERVLAESGGQLISHPLSAELVTELEKAVESGEVQVEVDADNGAEDSKA